jgi:hypothetical protein
MEQKKTIVFHFFLVFRYYFVTLPTQHRESSLFKNIVILQLYDLRAIILKHSEVNILLLILITLINKVIIYTYLIINSLFLFFL